MRADRRLSPEAIEAIREAIGEAGGNEVFLVGKAGEDGRVASVTVGARGSDDAVPVLRPHLAGGDAVIHNHPSGGGAGDGGSRPGAGGPGPRAVPLAPSRADLSIAARLGDEGIGFYIVDNAVEEVYVVAEPVAAREIALLDVPSLAGALEPGGGLARLVPWFEERPSQVGMLRAVAGAFNGDGILAVEAGTGVGKSMAYLLPSLAWAAANGERVVVSTNTINLQQQLVEKDIPLAKRVLGGADLRVALVKGRGNYLCRHRLAEAVEETTLFQEPDAELAAIGEWALTTATGDRTDLSFYPSDETWSRICSEPDACLGLRCSRRESCFVLKARREASAAAVLVANHHLLFADLSFRLAGGGFDDPAVLPPFRRVVFDEAHNIEKAATSFFSRSFNRFSLLRYLNRLHRRRRGRVAGLVPMLARISGHPLKGVPGLIAAVREAADVLDERCAGLMGAEGTFLLEPHVRERFLVEAGAALADLSARIRELVESFAEAVQKAGADARKESENLAWECRVQLNRLNEAAGIADRFRAAEIGANDVFWMEALRARGAARPAGREGATADTDAGPSRPAARLVITPLDIGPLMREAVYEPLPTVVFTSATLTVAGDFGYWAGRIGLDRRAGREPATGVFPSPFDYRENVLLGVPTDAPAPDATGYRPFLAGFLGAALAASRGGALVLFTSRALLAEMHRAVAPGLAGLGIRVLRQGDDDRARLLDRFRDDASSVLFATDSFWEGVDAPGDTLHAVVLCRLPFRVPSEPVLKARMAAIEAEGGNSFAALSLPDAVVRMRQGFGRLMRRRDDRGVVLVLDSRIVTKRYGGVFLDSLPPARRLVAGSAEVLAAVAEFFGPEQPRQ